MYIVSYIRTYTYMVHALKLGVVSYYKTQIPYFIVDCSRKNTHLQIEDEDDVSSQQLHKAQGSTQLKVHNPLHVIGFTL
jgi:hypothetical protein